MERRFDVRKEELLAGCQVSPEAFAGVLRRLEKFAEPFVASLPSPESQQHGRTYLSGLLSDVDRKNTESIAYRHDVDRQVLQRFIGYSSWDHQPLLDELTDQVARDLGNPDAVIVFDPSAFAKRGTESVGVQRQWCGRLGKTENCQVGVYLGYVSRHEHALVDMRLYLPEVWARDRKRRQKCGVPGHVRFQTRHQLALEMLDERGDHLPHAWVAGDDEMGRPAWFRRELQERNERYLLAVPSNLTIRDLEAPPPVGVGRPTKPRFQQMQAWCAALPEAAWTRIVVRDGEKGPVEVEAVSRRVQAKIDGCVADFEETMFVTRCRAADGTTKHDYHLSNAPRETPLAEFARVANDEHRIEQCLERGKSEAGLADYQTRSWLGWHHHQTLSLLAVWFLVQETRRGEKKHTGADGPAGPRRPGADPASGFPLRHAGTHRRRENQTSRTKRARTTLPLQGTQPLSTVEGTSARVA